MLQYGRRHVTYAVVGATTVDEALLVEVGWVTHQDDGFD